ncbi:MAG: hypothetical protein FJ095_02745 [Deltaproteobacteria bacterium]|nr:hypothetical protein [Deltaproteobacteria bacterium]
MPISLPATREAGLSREVLGRLPGRFVVAAGFVVAFDSAGRVSGLAAGSFVDVVATPSAVAGFVVGGGATLVAVAEGGGAVTGCVAVAIALVAGLRGASDPLPFDEELGFPAEAFEDGGFDGAARLAARARAPDWAPASGIAARQTSTPAHRP